MQTTGVLCYTSWRLNAKPMSLNSASPPPPRKTSCEVITYETGPQTLFQLSSCSVCFCLMLWHVFGETWCAFPLPLFLYVSASTRHVRIYVSLYIYMMNVFYFFLKKKQTETKGDEHVHAVDVSQSCMLHAAVRVEWVGNLHPNVFVWLPAHGRPWSWPEALRQGAGILESASGFHLHSVL